MSRHNHLQIRGEGGRATVVLDGVELQDGLAGLTLTMCAGELPQLRLDPLVITTAVDYKGPAAAHVHPGAREVLIALGWTPPAHDEQATPAPR